MPRTFPQKNERVEMESIEEKYQRWLLETFPRTVLQEEQDKWLRTAFFGGFTAGFCLQTSREEAMRIQDQIDKFEATHKKPAPIGSNGERVD